MKRLIITLIVTLAVFVIPVPADAHGVRITYTLDEQTGEITVLAEFDTGERMDDAQVAIFAPDDLVNPWQTGTTDENGEYTFMPDYAIEGTWDVQVRKAGHGGLVNIPLDANMAPATDVDRTDTPTPANTPTDATQIVITGDAQLEITGDVIIRAAGGVENNNDGGITDGLSQVQIAIMSISVIWGFVGTALYFSARNQIKQTRRTKED
jgi:nickel transport protein